MSVVHILPDQIRPAIYIRVIAIGALAYAQFGACPMLPRSSGAAPDWTVDGAQ